MHQTQWSPERPLPPPVLHDFLTRGVSVVSNALPSIAAFHSKLKMSLVQSMVDVAGVPAQLPAYLTALTVGLTIAYIEGFHIPITRPSSSTLYRRTSRPVWIAVWQSRHTSSRLSKESVTSGEPMLSGVIWILW